MGAARGAVGQLGEAAREAGSAAAAALGGDPDTVEAAIDDIYEKVVDRLRRQLLLEREQMGDLTGDYL